MKISAEDTLKLIRHTGGGPVLELHAWFTRCDKFPVYAEFLGEPQNVAGPFANEVGWLLHGLEGGEHRLHEVRIGSTKGCQFVVMHPRIESPLLIRLSGSYLKNESKLEAYVSPANAACALGHDDWFTARDGLPWVRDMGHQANYPLYRALIDWWCTLTRFPTCSSLWLGYENYLEDDPTVVNRHKHHLITHKPIAQLLQPGKHISAGQYFDAIKWTDLGP